VLDNNTKLSQLCKSLREATRALSCTHKHLAKFNNRLYQNRYFITTFFFSKKKKQIIWYYK
jgi:hypothetical protein